MATDHGSVTSVRRLVLGNTPLAEMVRAPSRFTYIGMPGKAARAKGLPDNEVGPFGKPWSCLDDPRGWQIAYREYLWRRLNSDPAFTLAVSRLHGQVLVCWCKGKRPEHKGQDHCHGDILLKAIEWLNHTPAGNELCRSASDAVEGPAV